MQAPAFAQEENKKEFLNVYEAQTAYDKLLQTLKECSDEKSRPFRLICYDELALEIGLIPADYQKTERNILESIGLWEPTHVVNSLGADVYYFKLIPDNEIVGRNTVINQPELIVRCEKQDTKFYLDWKAYMVGNMNKKAQNIYIGHKINNGPTHGLEWQLSLDKYAAFHPNPVEFLRDLNGKSQLYLEFTAREGVQQLVFTLTGLDKVLEKVVEVCYQ